MHQGIVRIRQLIYILVWVNMLFSFHVKAQDRPYIPFYLKDTTVLTPIAEACMESVEASYILPSNVNREYRKAFHEITDDAIDEMEYLIRYTSLYDTILYPYLKSVLANIIIANPEFAHCRIILTRSPVENAFAFGDGTILFNVGLLAKMENESQVAFAICHELAHGFFRHPQMGIKKTLDAYFNKEFQKKVKQVERHEEFDKNKKIKELLVSFTMNRLYDMRLYEKQADSLGYFLLRKTQYDVKQSIRSLAMLDTIEKPYYAGKIDYAKYFNCLSSHYNFAIEEPKTKSIFQVKEVKTELDDSDSLSTHPDCQKRIGFLNEVMLTNPAPASTLPDNTRFEKIRLNARYEVIQSWFDYEYYDYALYNCLQMLEQNYNNIYLHSMIELCLYQLKSFMINHEYSEVVSNISKNNPDNFNDLIRILNRLNVDDFNLFDQCFFSTHIKSTEDEYLLAAAFASATIQNDKPAVEKLRSQYLKLYKDGRFSKMIDVKTEKKKKKY